MTLVLDAQDRPHIAYSDGGFLSYASKTSDEWEIQVVALPSADDRILGQLASLDIDPSGRPHLSY